MSYDDRDRDRGDHYGGGGDSYGRDDRRDDYGGERRDDRRDDGGYSRPSDNREYGGGGRQGDNYYDASQSYTDSSRPSGQDYGRHGGGGGRYDDDNNLGGAAHHAGRQGNSDDHNLFSQAASFLGQHKSRIENEEVNEDEMVGAHQKLYGSGSGQGGGGGHDANTLGAGAAMQALKMFTGGGGGGGSGGNSQNAFVGLAMAQAGKLFDEQSGQGNVQGGTDKQSVITQAGEMALKMYMKSQGGGGGGGAGGLMNLASKFL
jgi:hypothetical protein